MCVEVVATSPPVSLDAEVETSQPVAPQGISSTLKHNARRSIVFYDVLHHRAKKEGVT